MELAWAGYQRLLKIVLVSVATAIPSRHHPLDPVYKELCRVHWCHCTTTSLTLSNLTMQSFNVLSIKDDDITTRLQHYCGVLLGPTYCYQDCISMLMQVPSQCTQHPYLCSLHCPGHVPHVLQVLDNFTLLNFFMKILERVSEEFCSCIFLLLQA